MTERKRIQRALEPLHASDDTLEEVFAMIERDKAVKHLKHTGRNTLRTVTVAAALVLALSVTAYAVGEYTGFFETVFGDEAIGSWDTEHKTFTDEDGNVWKEYDIPGQERVSVDPDQAQALVGDETVNVGQSVTVEGVTFTVEDFVMDANGMGVLTYTMEDPNGFPGVEFDGSFMRPDPTVVGSLLQPQMTIQNANGKELGWMNNMQFVAASGTDTKKTVVYYFTATDTDSLADAEQLKLTFFIVTDYDADSGDIDTKEGGVIFPLSQAVAVTPLAGPDGWSASISPVGLQIVPPEGNPYGVNYVFGDLTIHMTDGTEYALEQDDPYMSNYILGGYGEDDDATSIVFNRLIDPAQVESVTAVGDGNGYQDADGSPVPYDQAWVEVEPELVGDTWTSSTALREGLTEMNVALDLTFTK